MAYRSVSTNATPAHPLVVTPPSGIVDGDILIAWAVTDSVNSVSFTLTGFTTVTGLPIKLDNASGTDGGYFWAGYKKAASESGSYSISNANSDAMNGGVICISGRDASSYLHRSSVGNNNTANNSPWTMTTAAFSSATAGTCDLVYIGMSDSKTSGTVTHTAPSGHTKRADVNSGFLQSFVSTLDGVSSGATGALSATGTQTSAQSGWACACIALLAAATAGSLIIRRGPTLIIPRRRYV